MNQSERYARNGKPAGNGGFTVENQWTQAQAIHEAHLIYFLQSSCCPLSVLDGGEWNPEVDVAAPSEAVGPVPSSNDWPERETVPRFVCPIGVEPITRAGGNAPDFEAATINKLGRCAAERFEPVEFQADPVLDELSDGLEFRPHTYTT